MGAEVTMGEFSRTEMDFGLSVSFTNSIVMVAGRKVTDTDTKLFQVGNEI